MNEFKFACPHCKQSIQATPEYAGVEINCPSCHATLVVPQPAEAAAAPKAGKLTKAPGTVHHAATSPVMAAATVRKAKKPRIGLYVGLGVGAVVVAAGIIFVPKLIDKYNAHKEEVAAAQAAITNPPPPPPPPELTADEIVKKLGVVYRTFTTYGAQAETTGEVDMSAVTPTIKEPLHPKVRLSVLLGRPARYRFEWERQVGTKSFNGAAWSAGKGDFVRTGMAATRTRDWQSALSTTAAASGSLGNRLADLFFDSTNSVAVVFKNYARTNDETIDGDKCYVLTGKINSQNMLLWIRRDNFLIAQAELFLGGKLEDSDLAGLNGAQKAQAIKNSKIRGNIMETYSDFHTNQALADEDFQVPATPIVLAPKAPKAKQPKQKKSSNNPH